MTDESEELTRLFASAGWAALPTKESLIHLGFTGVYVSTYAAVGVLILPSSEKVVTHWTDYQEAMIQIRKEDSVGSEKDLYLLFIVQWIDANDASRLQEILDDTHVCRKLLIERKERALSEALYDS